MFGLKGAFYWEPFEELPEWKGLGLLRGMLPWRGSCFCFMFRINGYNSFRRMIICPGVTFHVPPEYWFGVLRELCSTYEKGYIQVICIPFLPTIYMYNRNPPRGKTSIWGRPMGNLRLPSALLFFADITGILVSHSTSYARILAIIRLLPDLHFSSFFPSQPKQRRCLLMRGITPGPLGDI